MFLGKVTGLCIIQIIDIDDTLNKSIGVEIRALIDCMFLALCKTIKNTEAISIRGEFYTVLFKHSCIIPEYRFIVNDPRNCQAIIPCEWEFS